MNSIYMNDIYYYLILGVLLYFLFTYILERFSNLEQENFDTSLVPVSSIVTLAKVAQKFLVNNTFINPSNLLIGSNLRIPSTMTVGNTINGSKTFNVVGTADVNGATTIGDTLNVTDATKLSTLNTTGKAIIGSTLDQPNTFNVIGTVDISGDTTIDKSLAVTKEATLSTLNISGNTVIGSKTSDLKNYKLNVVGTAGISGNTMIGSTLEVKSDTTLSKLNISPSPSDVKIFNSNRDLNVTGNANITNNITIGGHIFDTAGQFRLVLQTGDGDSPGKCLTAKTNNSVSLQPCTKDDTQYWFQLGGRFISKSNKKCLTIIPTNAYSTTITTLTNIDATNENQIFSYVETGNIITRNLGSYTVLKQPFNIGFMGGNADNTIGWGTACDNEPSVKSFPSFAGGPTSLCNQFSTRPIGQWWMI